MRRISSSQNGWRGTLTSSALQIWRGLRSSKTACASGSEDASSRPPRPSPCRHCTRHRRPAPRHAPGRRGTVALNDYDSYFRDAAGGGGGSPSREVELTRVAAAAGPIR